MSLLQKTEGKKMADEKLVEEETEEAIIDSYRSEG